MSIFLRASNFEAATLNSQVICKLRLWSYLQIYSLVSASSAPLATSRINSQNNSKHGRCRMSSILFFSGNHGLQYFVKYSGTSEMKHLIYQIKSTSRISLKGKLWEISCPTPKWTNNNLDEVQYNERRCFQMQWDIMSRDDGGIKWETLWPPAR